MQRNALSLVFIITVSLSACAGSSSVAERHPGSLSGPFDGHFDEICSSGFVPVLKGDPVKLLAHEMAPRDHRIWHNFWHSTRNSWHKLNKEQRDFFIKLDPRWEPSHLLGTPPGAVATAKYDPKKNGAGEDFLFMHHTMMTELFTAFGNARLPCPEPWLELPKKGDRIWPVEQSRDGKDEKSDAAFAQMDGWRKQFQNPKYLKGKTLGEVGYLLENSLHNNMHMRFGTYDPPKGFGDRPEISPATLGHGLDAYDAPGYDWLYDSYSAHVNPTFWKLHGLVENVLFDWLKANGKTEVEEDCAGRATCYQWKGTWVGAQPGMLRGIGGGHDKGHGDAGFADRFQQAYDDFLNGVAQPPEGADPHGPVRAVPLPNPAEKERRKKLLTEAFQILQKNSAMDRGRLNGARLERVRKAGPVSAEEYVKWVDSEE